SARCGAQTKGPCTNARPRWSRRVPGSVQRHIQDDPGGDGDQQVTAVVGPHPVIAARRRAQAVVAVVAHHVDRPAVAMPALPVVAIVLPVVAIVRTVVAVVILADDHARAVVVAVVVAANVVAVVAAA